MLTNDQKQSVIDALASPFCRVKLLARRNDRDFEITAAVEPVRAMQYRVIVYVDGRINGAWFRNDSPHPETAFMRRSEKKMFSKKEIESFRRVLGKKRADDAAKEIFVWYYPDFPSGKSMINHMLRVSENVELLSQY